MIDLTGKRFGRLVVLEDLGRRGTSRYWKCQCDCGVVTETRGNHLLRGASKSCGCYRGTLRGWHGMKRTPAYTAWQNIISRCENKKDKSYPNYGGRGVDVCDRWRNSFLDFLADMGHRPSDKHTIDRRNNDGNYEPSNCRWATRSEQAKNRRTTVMICWDDHVMCLKDACEFFGQDFALVRGRIHSGWSVSDALTRPVDPQGGQFKQAA